MQTLSPAKVCTYLSLADQITVVMFKTLKKIMAKFFLFVLLIVRRIAKSYE